LLLRTNARKPQRHATWQRLFEHGSRVPPAKVWMIIRTGASGASPGGS
jgi:hypothetical protein